MGNKVRNLVKIEKQILKSKLNYVVPKFLFFNKKVYLNNKDKILKKILCKFKKKKKIIIRSSSLNEDIESSSQAGKYISIISRLLDIEKNIEIVINKLSQKDFFIIQDVVTEVDMFGVLFTRGLSDNSPYIYLNVDSSKRTNLITAGRKNVTMKSYVIHRSLKYIPKKFKNITKMSRFLENIFKTDRLDIEFAIKNKKIYIFQCRNLIKKEKKSNFTNELINIEKKIQNIFKNKINISGKKNFLSNMTDWNPAEIIGVKPSTLAISMYKYLITDEAWAIHRDKFGYKNVRPNPLMINLGGSPYIDARVDFNSFLPKNLNPRLQDQVIDWYINLLIKKPHLHDKVEFNTIPNYLPIVKKLNIKFLVDKKKKIYQSKLKNINNFYFCDKEFKKDISKLKKHNLNLINIKKTNSNEINKVSQHIYNCKVNGIIPFASMARRAFISISIIKEFEKNHILSQEELSSFFNSVNTISKEINNFLVDVQSKRKTAKQFFSKYGHLRPSSYDIDYQNYRKGFKKYFNLKNLIKKNKQKFNLKSKIKLRLLNNLNLSKFLDYARKTIEQREFFKLEFMKSIDEIFINLEKFFIKNIINTKDLKYIKIQTLIDANSNLSLEKYKSILKREIRLNKREYKKNYLIKLPDTIKSHKDIYCFKINKSQPNYVTNLDTTGEILILNNLNKKNINLDNRIVAINHADPGYDFIFSHNILGLITQYGGPNSHMAIRCEEMNIPAIIGFGENFKDLKNNGKFTIDAKNQKFYKF